MAWSNAKQHIPPLFQEIIKNQARCAEIKAQPVLSLADLSEFKRLRSEMKAFRQAAMKALQRVNDPNNRSI